MNYIIKYFFLITTTNAVKLNVKADVAIGPEYAYHIKGSYEAEAPNLRVKVRESNESIEYIHSSKTDEVHSDTSEEDFSETFFRKRKEPQIVQRHKLETETTKHNKHSRHNDRHEKQRHTKHATHKHKAPKDNKNKYKEKQKSTRSIRTDLTDENDSYLPNNNENIFYKEERNRDLKQTGTRSLSKLINMAGKLVKQIPGLKQLQTVKPRDVSDIMASITLFREIKNLTNLAIKKLNFRTDNTRVYNFTDSVVYVNDTHITILKNKMADKPKHQQIRGIDNWIKTFKNKTIHDIDKIKDTLEKIPKGNITNLNNNFTNFANATIFGFVTNVTNMIIQNASELINNKLKNKSLNYATNIESRAGNYVFKNNTHKIIFTQVKNKPPVTKIETKDKKNNHTNVILLNGTTMREIRTYGDDIFIRNCSTNKWIKINKYINTRTKFKANEGNNDQYTKKYVFENQTHKIIATQENNKPPVIKIKIKHLKNKKNNITRYLRSHHKHEKNEKNKATNTSRTEREPNNWADLKYKVEQDEQVDAFTKHILRDTVKLLYNVKNNIKEYQWRNQINRVSKQYEVKFNEFLRTTRHQKIKTRLGTQKVVLNAIEMSKLIVNRLLNAAIHDLEKKGSLRSGGDANTVYNKINKEVESKRNRACNNLGICVNDKGFTHYIVQVMNTILSLDDEKYQEVLDATVDAVENTDFSNSLSKSGDRALKKAFNDFRQHDIKTQKAVISIIRNQLFSKNMPLVIHEDSNADQSKLNKTLAFLEIVNALDKYQGNKEWEKIEREINDYSRNDLGINIRDTMDNFVTSIRDAIDHSKSHSRDIIRANIKTVFT